MQQEYFFTLAVGAGFLLISLVVYSYLRPSPEHRPALTALLGVLGFALIASPNWTQISIRSDGLELSLLREIEGRQLRALTALQERLAAAEAPAEPGADAAAPPPQTPPPSGRVPQEPDGAPQETAPGEEPLQSRGAAGRALARDAEAERLIDAYHRGELDLGALSDDELLALNEQLGRVRHWARR